MTLASAGPDAGSGGFNPLFGACCVHSMA